MSKTRASTLWQAALRAVAIASLLLWGLVVADVARQVGAPFPGFRCEEGLSVSPQTDPAWNGPRAGLKAYDYVLSANGRTLARVGELKAIVASLPPGAPIAYEVWREGRTVTVVVPTQVLTWPDALTGFGPVLAVGLLHMLIGIGGFWLQPGHAAAQAHLLLTLVIGLAFQTLGVDFTLTHRLGRVYQSLVHLSGSVMLHLALVFPAPGAWLQRRPWVIALAYAPSLVMGGWQLAIYDPLGMAMRGAPASGPAHDWLFLGWGLWTIVGALALIASAAWAAARGARLEARRQGSLVLAGAVLGFTPGLLVYMLPALAGQTAGLSLPLVGAAQAALALFPLAIALAVLRHRLFEIEVWIKRTAAYSMALASLVGLYACVLFAAGHVLGHQPAVVTGLAALAVGLACMPAFRAARLVLDRLFFRAPYDFQEVATRFSDTARRLLEPEALLACYGATIDRALHPDYLLVLEGHGGQPLTVLHQQGPVPADLFEPAGLATITETFAHAEPFAPTPLARPSGEALLIPLAMGGSPCGLVVLGPRRSELDYMPPDRRLIVHVSQQLAVFCQNAQLYAGAVRQAEALAAANAELRQLDELKRHFLNTVSHELRTPLSSIIGFGEFLKDEVGGPLTPLQQEFVQHVRTGARRLQGLVDDLLDYAQVEAGAFRLDPEWADLSACVKDALDSLAPQAGEKRLTLMPVLPETDVLWVFDSVRMEQVILNLVGNAIKFTPEGGTIRVSLAREDDHVRLEVTDSGIGIPAELLPRLFDKFYQVDSTTTRRYGGAGLGLPITRAIVEAHGGAITVASRPGEGSAFTVTLPRPAKVAVVPAAQAPAGHEVSAAQAEAP